MDITTKLNHMLADIKAQGGIVGFFIGAMIAVIIALQVTWPVIDQVMYNGDNITANLSGPAASLVEFIPIFLVVTLVMVFVRPLLFSL